MASYAFGPFVLDDAGRTLYRDGMPVPLTGKVFDLIACLVKAQGEVVRKNALVDRVWGQNSINDTTIGQHVYLARKALRDIQRPHQYIRTVHAIGYRMAADVRMTDDAQPAVDTSQSAARLMALELLSGAHYFRRGGTRAGLASCLSLCAKAAAFDRSLADAHGTAALTRIFQALYLYEPPRSAYAFARADALCALDADRDNALANVALGCVYLFGEQDADRAAVHFGRAAATRPDVQDLHVFRVLGMIAQGHVDAAVRAATQATRWIPQSAAAALYQAVALYHAHELEAAQRRLELLLALRPDIGFAQLMIGVVRLARGQYLGAQEAFERILLQKPADLATYEKFGVFARAGLAHVQARTLGIDPLSVFVTERDGQPCHYARAVALAGAADEGGVRAELDQAAAAREPWSVLAQTDPLFTAYRLSQRHAS